MPDMERLLGVQHLSVCAGHRRLKIRADDVYFQLKQGILRKKVRRNPDESKSE